jgi:type III pantothenate kinase
MRMRTLRKRRRETLRTTNSKLRTKFLLIDISNTFTKIALSSPKKVGTIHRIATSELTATRLHALISKWSFTHAVVASVVPVRNSVITKVIKKTLRIPLLWVDTDIDLGIGVDYPDPRRIGADRLANSVACAELYGTPGVVVDFGTAVTFDIISAEKNYVGGVIAPGMAAFTEYLPRKTALLPHVVLKEPHSVLGKSTVEALCSGAVIGYRGLVREILARICQEVFPKNCTPKLIATGGDAKLVGGRLSLFDAINQKLTLEGLRLIAVRNFRKKTVR